MVTEQKAIAAGDVTIEFRDNQRKSIGCPETDDYWWHQVERYWASSNQHWYFRYIYRFNGWKLNRIHIPGGNTDNPIAQARAEEVTRWIAGGRSPVEIETLIHGWRRGKTKSSGH